MKGENKVEKAEKERERLREKVLVGYVPRELSPRISGAATDIIPTQGLS